MATTLSPAFTPVMGTVVMTCVGFAISIATSELLVRTNARGPAAAGPAPAITKTINSRKGRRTRAHRAVACGAAGRLMDMVVSSCRLRRVTSPTRYADTVTVTESKASEDGMKRGGAARVPRQVTCPRD
jgi:hypothetical protein